MLRVGLTGGIGSGKSAVAGLLAGHGAVIVDADLLARRAVEPGTPGLARIVEEFGPGVLTPEGELNRPMLGGIVFSDPRARERLNAIVHPEVRRLSAAAERAADPGAIVVHVIPLLVETGQQELFDLIVVVDVDTATQLRRVAERDGLDEDQTRARIAAQASRQERLAVADLVIDNSGTFSELAARTSELWERLRRTA